MDKFQSSLRFQSTPPARGATGVHGHDLFFGHISIHAPREGGDVAVISVPPMVTFQSTPPARGATAVYTWRRTA